MRCGKLIVMVRSDAHLSALFLMLASQLAEQRHAAQEEAEARELAHLAELEAAQDGVLEVGAACSHCPWATAVHAYDTAF